MLLGGWQWRETRKKLKPGALLRPQHPGRPRGGLPWHRVPSGFVQGQLLPGCGWCERVAQNERAAPGEVRACGVLFGGAGLSSVPLEVLCVCLQHEKLGALRQLSGPFSSLLCPPLRSPVWFQFPVFGFLLAPKKNAVPSAVAFPWELTCY